MAMQTVVFGECTKRRVKLGKRVVPSSPTQVLDFPLPLGLS